MSVDPTRVPTVTLGNGQRMPCVGLGTFGSDQYGPDVVAEAVIGAAEVGYRHFDCAAVYQNEFAIGPALAQVRTAGVPRADLWITSKVWNDRHDDVASACEQSLRELGLDYLDLYLVHWPFPHHHAPGVDVGSRDPHARPYNPDAFLRTWRQMEALVHRGLVRAIGTSNMTEAKLRNLLPEARLRPLVNELELHPHFQQARLVNYLVGEGIQPVGYCPIGSPRRPERDRTPDDTVDTEDPVVVAIADRLGVHPAVVCVLWQVQSGAVPIPFSVKRAQYEATLNAVASLQLTPQDLAALAGIERGTRLIKGQVFLWEWAEDWRDLWN